MKPFVTIFNGISLDGRMDFGGPEIDMGLYYSLAATWNADAMLSGSGTMLTGMGAIPEMEACQPPAEYLPLAVPLLAIVDSRGQITNWNAIRSQPYWKEAVALLSDTTPAEHIETLKRKGVPFIQAGRNKVNLGAALEELNRRFGVKTIRIDSGGVLNGALLRAGLVDEVSVLIGPYVVGGTSPRTLFNAADLESDAGVIHLTLTHLEQLPNGVIWLKYEVKKA